MPVPPKLILWPKGGLPELAFVLITPPYGLPVHPHWEGYEIEKGIAFVNALIEKGWSENNIHIFALGFPEHYNAENPYRNQLMVFMNQFKLDKTAYDHTVVYISEHTSTIAKQGEENYALYINEPNGETHITKDELTTFLGEMKNRSQKLNVILNGKGTGRLMDMTHVEDGRVTMASHYVPIPLGAHPDCDHFNIGEPLMGYPKHGYDSAYEEERLRLLDLIPPQHPFRLPLQ